MSKDRKRLLNATNNRVSYKTHPFKAFLLGLKISHRDPDGRSFLIPSIFTISIIHQLCVVLPRGIQEVNPLPR